MNRSRNTGGENRGGEFRELTPDVVIGSVEEAMDIPFTALAHPLNSYINRVYELQSGDGTRYISKFYRPGRWSREALEEEHRFVAQCRDDEIPVVAPLTLADGSTLGDTDSGISFAVFPKRRGRELEPLCDEDWRRLGRAVGRMHVAGAVESAKHRPVLHPDRSTRLHVRQLLDSDVISAQHQREFESVCTEILDMICPAFEDVELQRVHGDCHSGNLLERPGEGILIIDFDDMALGPPVQDLWMLLPDYAEKARREINLILQGYEDFTEFDDRGLRLIEPLRVMRILYFMAWVSIQREDPMFHQRFPGWGTDAFWRKQIGDLQQQAEVIRTHL